MQRVYIGFDDTDNHEADRGTGKLARWFEQELPPGCRLWGVIRQQLLVHPDIPYTSHNSAACFTVDIPERGLLAQLTEGAADHLRQHALPGSDPGLCVAAGGNPALPALALFGQSCTRQVVSQSDAVQAAAGAHLSGHGGTDDGIIGAAAAVGLTASGWSGRFIEFGRLRQYPEKVPVARLEQAGIRVVSIDREARVPDSADTVFTNRWLRPRLLGNRAVLLVRPEGNGFWRSLGEKRKKGHSKLEKQEAAAIQGH